MSEINILDHLTIDQIAAGEVVERKNWWKMRLMQMHQQSRLK